MYIWQSIVTVSYTHLDVYKRQALDNRRQIGQTTALRESAHLRGDVAQLGVLIVVIR